MVRRLLAVLALALSACRAAEPEKATKLTAPTEEEARRYAAQFIGAVSKPNVARASNMIDWDILLERATANAGGSERFRRAFIRGAKRSTQTSAYVQQMAKLAGEGASMSLLRVRGDAKERRALLRVILPGGGVTYNEMLLTRDEAGWTRAADIYTYATGEWSSAAIRRLYLSAIAGQPSVLGRLAGQKNEAVEAALSYQELSSKVLAGKHQEIVDYIRRLPPHLRREKNVLAVYVSSAAHLDDAQYGAAIDELRKHHPNDPGLDLMLIDGFFLKERYDDAQEAVDRLDRSLGGDPYLDALRSNMYLAAGDLGEATRFAQRAAEREPGLVDAQWALVRVSLVRRDFDETARLLTRIEEEFGQEIADLTEIPEYAEFVKSEAYERWRRTAG